MMDLGNQDILESFWQMALLKKDLANQHPYLYDFVNAMYIHKADIPTAELKVLFEEKVLVTYNELQEKCDVGLFRDDIDHIKAIDIISLTMDSVIEDEDAKAISTGGWDDQKYEQFLENLRGYLDIFRACFYKQQ